MQKTIILLILIVFQADGQCHKHEKREVVKGKSAICILHEDNKSGVKGIVTIHQ